MSTIDMKQVAGLQAVNAEGKVIGTLSVDDLTELVSAKIIQEAKNEAVSARSASVMSEASTLAATDEYEDQLALDTNPAYVRSLDTNGNPKRTAIASLASVVGGLILPSTYSELNYGDMNNFVSPMIRTINTFGDTSFEKLNWPKKIMYGTFCVNVYDKNIIQEIYGLNGYAFRLYVSDVWSEWIEFEKTS